MGLFFRRLNTNLSGIMLKLMFNNFTCSKFSHEIYFPNSVYFNPKLTVPYMSNLDRFYELRDESLLFSVVGSAMSSEVSFS